ncbi:MAG: hypothetical protein VKJ64_01015 [Leptolyngbyaceae bacterium]|nr:hypothetical protein [Leptolyngbyaceae bacterium]
MTSTTYQIPLTFEQILTLVKQLPPAERQQLSQELAKDLIVFPALGDRLQQKEGDRGVSE